MNQEPDFYVGYQPHATAATRAWTLRAVIAIVGVSAVIVVLLLAGQAVFPGATFEYGEFKPFQGVLAEWPHPALVQGEHRLLLVAAGKHGIDVQGKAGVTTSLRGARIGIQMLEVEAGSLQTGSAQKPDTSPVSLGQTSLTGEIVDSKCHFGVMNPGSGKVHRDCAARCISGGIPPGFLVRDGDGHLHTLLLAGVAGRDILDMVAEPVTIRGELKSLGASTLILQVSSLDDIKRRE